MLLLSLDVPIGRWGELRYLGVKFLIGPVLSNVVQVTVKIHQLQVIAGLQHLAGDRPSLLPLSEHYPGRGKQEEVTAGSIKEANSMCRYASKKKEESKSKNMNPNIFINWNIWARTAAAFLHMWLTAVRCSTKDSVNNKTFFAPQHS